MIEKQTDPIMDVSELLEQARNILLSDHTGRLRSAQPIEAKLDRIFELRGTESEIAKDIDQMIEKLQVQRKSLVQAVVEEYDRLSSEVKIECLETKATVAGKYLQVVYAEGTRSWNSDGLEDYAKSHPEVMNFRKQSAPVAKIVAVKKEKKK